MNYIRERRLSICTGSKVDLAGTSVLLSAAHLPGRISSCTPQPLQKFGPFARGPRRIRLFIFVNLVALTVKINFLWRMQFPRSSIANSPDFVSSVQYDEDWGAKVGEQEVVHGPITICKDNPAIGLLYG